MFQSWSQALRDQHLSGYRFEPKSTVDLPAPQGEQTQLCWLHGNGFNSLAYTPLFEALLSDISQDDQPLSVFSTDLPGHGHSSAAPQGWPDWPAMAAAVEQAMQHQLVDEALSCRRLGIGHSLGGVLTLMQAYQNPSRFEKILLLDPVLFSPVMMLGQRALKTLGLWPRVPLAKQALRRRNCWQSTSAMQQQLARKSFYRRWHPQALAGFVEGGHRRLDAEIGRQGPTQDHPQPAVELSCSPQWEAQIFASYPRLLSRALKQVQIPVQIICAEQSMPFVLKGAKRAAALNANISYRIWGQGHCFPMEQPEQTAELIRQWVAATD